MSLLHMERTHISYQALEGGSNRRTPSPVRAIRRMFHAQRQQDLAANTSSARKRREGDRGYLKETIWTFTVADERRVCFTETPHWTVCT